MKKLKVMEIWENWAEAGKSELSSPKHFDNYVKSGTTVPVWGLKGGACLRTL